MKQLDNQDRYFDIRGFLESFAFESKSDCPYFTEKKSREKVIYSLSKLPAEYLDVLLDLGYRRSGDYFYRQECEQCFLCIGYRIPLENFILTKSQKRILKKNRDLKIEIASPHVNDEKEKIYIEYQYHQHHLNEPKEKPQASKFNENNMIEVMQHQMYGNIHNSIEMEIYLENRLIAFSIIDIGKKSASAVYSVYSIEHKKRGLGNFLILKMIEWARNHHYDYLYLGYYIPGHSKMDYKSKFQPAEYLDAQLGLWKRFDLNAPFLAYLTSLPNENSKKE